MANGVYKASEIVDGKVSIQEFDQRFVIVWDTGNGGLLIEVINLMAGH